MKAEDLLISSPVKPFYNIGEIVDHATTIIEDATDLDRVIFRQWAWLGERQLGFGGFNEETKDIVVEDLSIRKPRDMAQPIDIALYDSAGAEYQYKYQSGKKRIHIVDPNQGKIDISEDPYFFHLGSNGAGIAYAKFRYYAYPIDDDNNPMFPEHHILALMMFIRWMWAIKKNTNRSEIAEAKADWLGESMKAKSSNKIPHKMKSDEITKQWMSMIDKIRYADF
jgi:hypothetical protein